MLPARITRLAGAVALAGLIACSSARAADLATDRPAGEIEVVDRVPIDAGPVRLAR